MYPHSCFIWFGLLLGMRATAVNPWLRSLGTRCEFWPTRRQSQAREQRLFVREIRRNLWWWCVVNQCGLEQLNKASLPDRSIVTQFFFPLRKALPFWEECAEDSRPIDQTQECVHICLTQQSALCGINHNPWCFKDILLSLFKDNYIYMDDD